MTAFRIEQALLRAAVEPTLPPGAPQPSDAELLSALEAAVGPVTSLERAASPQASTATLETVHAHLVDGSTLDLLLKSGGRDTPHEIAAYRDESGELVALSRKCKHLGCGVGWNASLSTWDCPCHGSRFAVDGSLVQGPATADLPADPLP